MKAPTIRQPWASAILHAFKREEYRNWAPLHRGDLAIHSARALPADADIVALHGLLVASAGRAAPSLRQVWEWSFQQPLGHVLGTVQLVGVRPFDSPWGSFAWQLSAPCWLPRPIRARGQLGLWSFVAPPAVSAPPMTFPLLW
jgi:ASCH domain